MFENILKFFKKMKKGEEKPTNSKSAAKERLHLVLMQDRANVSADFLDLMRQEIIDVIKKYIEVDESAIDVRLTNKENEDGTNGAPALYANIPIVNIKNEARKVDSKKQEENKNTIMNNKKDENKTTSINNEKNEVNNKENSSNEKRQENSQKENKEEKPNNEKNSSNEKKEENSQKENKEEKKENEDNEKVANDVEEEKIAENNQNSNDNSKT